MPFTDDEWVALSRMPELEVIALAADLDICVPAEIDRESLLSRCVTGIVARAQVEGLPFSKYDREDLAELPTELLDSIGRLQGLSGRVTVRAVLRVGDRVYRSYQKNRPGNPVALMLPMLLAAVAREAMKGPALPTQA
ncbi:MAG: hypothetical protein ACI8PZ_005530 [Myxococcota bacterium]|jgi:hypothetical protein